MSAASTPSPAEPGLQIGPGTLVLVVGPSGAGKDTLLDAARVQLKDDPKIRFVTRMITRPETSGGEAHVEIDEPTFNRMVSGGDCALAWRAHGLGYLLPASIDSDIMAGYTLVANGSRRILTVAEARYKNCLVINVTAPAHILAERLASRGRESREDIEARLARTVSSKLAHGRVVEIVNDRTVEEGATALIDALQMADAT